MYPSSWKLVVYGFIVLLGTLLAVPSFLSSRQLDAWPDWLPKKVVALGLDLKGGAHLELQIDSQALERESLDALLRDVKHTLAQQHVGGIRGTVEGDAVVLRADSAARVVTAAQALRAADDGLRLDSETADDGSVRLRPAKVTLRERQAEALKQSLEIVRRRIDAFGVAEPTVQRLGDDRILVQLPGVQDPSELRALLGSTAKLGFHRVQGVGQTVPTPPGFMRLADAAGNSYVLEQTPMVQGDRLISAQVAMDPRGGGPVVSFRFDAAGARAFAEATRENVGRPFAIVLDDKVISAPVIEEPITGGAGQIKGHFTTAEATTLAVLLRAGALPVPLKVVQGGVVGPDLGADAIRMGAMTGVAGFLCVLAFMTVLYGRWGLIANVALVLNVMLTFAALALFNITLTLPGIAGIVLGIGLAVDANVLINERIREETRNGKSASAALRSGFERAYATIVDSNATTLIATALLFWIGSGAVQGFAVTMGIGIAISMFTAVAVVHSVMTWWVRRARPERFVIGSWLPRRWLQHTPAFRFMRARFIGLGLSAVLSIASLALAVKPGLDFGIDFTGGVMLEAQVGDAASFAEVRGALERAAVGEVAVQQVDDTSVLARIAPPSMDGETQARTVERARQAVHEIAPQASVSAAFVGPEVSSELRDSGILAVLLASLAMFAYIWWRFDVAFATGAIVTLALDVTKTLGFFALTGIEFNLTAIAALLTLIGYSVNDKVVVYDRIRERRQREPGRPLLEIIDDSINETLARSLYTSATALLALLPMALWGGVAVKSFAVPMVFGIVVAASSSVFIAAPILLMVSEWRVRRGAGSLPAT